MAASPSLHRAAYNPVVRATAYRFSNAACCLTTGRLLQTVLLAALLLMAVGCPGPGKGGDTASGGRPSKAGQKPGTSAVDTDSGTLAYTGNFVGFQRPCGCSTKQDGGLVRLGTAMRYLHAGNNPQARSALTPLPAGAVLEFPANLPADSPVWLLECGNFADPKSRTPGQRAEVHLSALMRLGCLGAVLGAEELALDSENARQGLAGAPLPLLSCNLRSTLPEIRVVPSAELSPGWYALGVSVPKPGLDPPCAWGELSDALSSAEAAIAALPEGSRVIIAGAGIPPALARQLRELKVAGRNIVAVIGHADATDAAAREAALDSAGLPALLAPPEPRGKKLRLASFYPSAPAGVLSWDLTLDDKWPDDAAVLSLLRDGEEALRQAARSDPGNWRNVDWGSQGGMSAEEAAKLGQQPAPPLEQTYAGSQSCKACHSAALKPGRPAATATVISRCWSATRRRPWTASSATPPACCGRAAMTSTRATTCCTTRWRPWAARAAMARRRCT